MNKLTGNSALVISLISAGLIFASSALAVNTPYQAQVTKSVSQGAVAKQNAISKLDDAKLKMCQAKENAIKQRSSRLTQLVITMKYEFDAIEKRVEDYYNLKVVPSGKTVSNYSSLLSDIQTKKVAVSTALTKAQNDVNAFSCTSDNPKGQMTEFRIDMQSVKSALKDYRTSIKNLIVAVHSVTGETNKSKEASPTGGNK